MLSLGAPFELRADDGGHPLPAGELPARMLYEHLQLFVDKMRTDLRKIGAWDKPEVRSSGVPVPSAENDRWVDNRATLQGFSTDMPWNPYKALLHNDT